MWNRFAIGNESKMGPSYGLPSAEPLPRSFSNHFGSVGAQFKREGYIVRD